MNIIKLKFNKNFFVGLFFIFSFLFSPNFIFAAPPATRYAPGETLNPTCGPLDTNCAVDQIYVNPTTLLYGIGTNTPTAKLTINGTAALSLGPELITNGTFTSTEAPWTLGSDAVFNAGTNDVTILYTSGAPSVTSAAFSMLANNQYTISFTISGANSDVDAYFISGGGNPSIDGRPFTNGTYTISYTATNTASPQLEFASWNYAPGDTFTVDNVSVKKKLQPAATLDVVGYDGNSWLSVGGNYLKNTALGGAALALNSTGINNVALGYQTLTANTTGRWNTAAGASSLVTNTTGDGNTANGFEALKLNTTGTYNTAIGHSALVENTTGFSNVANGGYALRLNTTGHENVAEGYNSLASNTTGYYNIAIGVDSMGTNTTGASNTSIGVQTLNSSTGDYNTAFGYQAGYSNVDGSNNTFLGRGAGYTDGSVTTSGSLTNATAIGYNAQVTASNSLILGGTGAYGANVGIGTTAPSAKLEIANNLAVGTGPELITNGSFTGSAAGWTLGGNAAYGTNNVVSTYIGGDPSVATTFASVSGNTYLLTFTVSGANSPTSIHFANNTAIGFSLMGPFNNGTHTVVFPTNYTGTDTFSFSEWNYTNGDTWTVDDVSIKLAPVSAPALKVVGNDGATVLSLGADNLGNLALGSGAFSSNTGGWFNTATGTSALHFNTKGEQDTAHGANALYSNTTGSANTAVGASALYSNTTGVTNTAVGTGSLSSNTTGNYNTANGWNALITNIIGNGNTASGSYALGLSTGSENVAFGDSAGYGMTTGSRNILIGPSTISASYNQVTTGSNNISIGNDVAVATATASNQLNIGNFIYGTGLGGTGATISTGNIGIGVKAPSNIFHVTGTPAAGTHTARIANTLGGTTQNNGLLILAGNDTGVATSELITFKRPDNTTIGTITQTAAAAIAYNSGSDRRIKDNIVPTVYGLSDLMKINVDDFTFISDINKQKMTGFIAQELKDIYPGAVTTNGDNGTDVLTEGMTPWMIDYSKLTPLLTKSIQDLNLNIEGVTGTITPIPGSPSETFMTAFFNNVYAKVGAWLADAGNGITDIFANTFHAKDKLCINNTCVTESQLQTLLQNSGTPAPITPTPDPVPALTPDPVVPTCTEPQILVNNVCTDPAPEPISDPTTPSADSGSTTTP